MKRLRDLSLFWKLLLPFVVLLLVTGAAGGFLVVRNLASQARTRLDADLDQRSLAVRASAHDQELYLLESANFASNLQGVAEATHTRNAGGLTQALLSVLALKKDLAYAAIADTTGATIVGFERSRAGTGPAVVPSNSRLGVELVDRVRRDPDGAAAIGFVANSGRAELTVATAICSGPAGCVPSGVAIVAIEASRLVPARVDGAVYDEAGRQVSVRGLPPAGKVPSVVADNRTIRRDGHSRGTAAVTAYSPLLLAGRNHGMIAVTLPTRPAFASVRSSAMRLALVLTVVMLGIIAIGAALSRSILRQVRSVVATTARLGNGDLTARAPVGSGDEIGQLSRGVNVMADQLQASYDTLEQRVADRTAEVQNLLEERSDFFAALSHELRTPVAVFLAHADLLEDPTFPKKAAWQARASANLRAAGNQILKFVEDILALARTETGGIELEPEPVSLQDAIGDLRPTFDAMAQAAGVGLHVRLPKSLPKITADRARLRDILVNLIDNAIKYTPAGGRVDVSATKSGEQVSLSVGDTGVGIPAQAIERVFEPFFRVESTSTQGGQPSSGLGLALVKRLVEAHGGTVGVVSRSHKGSTFTVTFAAAGHERRVSAG